MLINPNSESRTPKEIRDPKTEARTGKASARQACFRISAIGFRLYTLDLTLRPSVPVQVVFAYFECFALTNADKSEFRIPNSERNPGSENRSSNRKGFREAGLLSDFGLRSSFGHRDSEFGLHFSTFGSFSVSIRVHPWLKFLVRLVRWFARHGGWTLSPKPCRHRQPAQQ